MSEMLRNSFVVQEVEVGYQRQAILSEINFELVAGELVALLGRNGTGKTTLLKTISGHLPPISGNCWVNKQNIHRISNRELARQISIVNTERFRMPHFKVMDLLELGRFPHTNFIGKLATKDLQIINNTIQEIDIEHLIHKNLNQLSDGELQKVLIARAIVQDTPFIFLDEPTTHLDLINRYQIFQLLKNLARKHHKTILLSTHEVEIALQLADKILLISPKTSPKSQKKAKQLIVASPSELIQSNAIQTAFINDVDNQRAGISFDSAARRFIFS